jgi:hypothetical protein
MRQHYRGFSRFDNAELHEVRWDLQASNREHASNNQRLTNPEISLPGKLRPVLRR